jgi:hypothetical protein
MLTLLLDAVLPDLSVFMRRSATGDRVTGGQLTHQKWGFSLVEWGPEWFFVDGKTM